MGNTQKKYPSFTRDVLPWIVTAVSVVTSIVFAVAFSMSTPEGAKVALDFAGKFFGPLGAAAIAWGGVHHTVRDTRRQDSLKVQQDELKEWYSNLRWAADLCSSNDPRSVSIGVATLDSIDGLPFLGAEQQALIDQILETVVESDGAFDTIGGNYAEINSDDEKEEQR